MRKELIAGVVAAAALCPAISFAQSPAEQGYHEGYRAGGPVGGLVGVTGPTKLATIVQLDPIYVTFNVSEQDVLRVKAVMRQRAFQTSI